LTLEIAAINFFKIFPMKYLKQMIWVSALVVLLITSGDVYSQRQMESLGRGVIALRHSPDSVFISWRMLGTDPDDIAFNVYRTSGGKSVKLNTKPIAQNTLFIDTRANFASANVYFVKAIIKAKKVSRANLLPWLLMRPFAIIFLCRYKRRKVIRLMMQVLEI
jgi:rhamnogalacturonan endolyase